MSTAGLSRSKSSQSAKASWRDPAQRAKRIAAIKAGMARPEVKEKLAARAPSRGERAAHVHHEKTLTWASRRCHACSQITTTAPCDRCGAPWERVSRG